MLDELGFLRPLLEHPFICSWFHQRLTFEPDTFLRCRPTGLGQGLLGRRRLLRPVCWPDIRTALPAFSDPSGFLPSSFAENTTTCYDHCPHLTSAVRRRRLENTSMRSCNIYDWMLSYPTVDRPVIDPVCSLHRVSPRRGIVAFAEITDSGVWEG